MRTTSALVIVSTLTLLASARGSDKKPLTFQVTLMAELVDTNAQKAGFHTSHFGSTVFKASNGAALTLMYGDFKNTDEARRFLEWNAQKCFKVLSQETRKDGKGSAIEYRAEIIPEWDHSSIEVMWVVGGRARWILAKNRPDALELESYYRRHSPERQ
jgi:hypothetical protein